MLVLVEILTIMVEGLLYGEMAFHYAMLVVDIAGSHQIQITLMAVLEVLVEVVDVSTIPVVTVVQMVTLVEVGPVLQGVPVQEGPDKAVPPEHLESHRVHYILAEVPEEPVSVGQAQCLMLVVLVLVVGPMEAAGMLSEVLLRLIREVAEVAEVALGILKCLEVLVAQESFY